MRDHAPTTGRFLYVDPELDPDAPQRLYGCSSTPTKTRSARPLHTAAALSTPPTVPGGEKRARTHNGSWYVNNGFGWFWKNVRKRSVKDVGTLTATTCVAHGTGNHPAPPATISFKAYKPKSKEIDFHGYATGSSHGYSPGFDAEGNTNSSVSVIRGAVGDILSGTGKPSPVFLAEQRKASAA
ncbi:hypothetical protein [Streptomyces sp. NPDC002690]